MVDKYVKARQALTALAGALVELDKDEDGNFPDAKDLLMMRFEKDIQRISQAITDHQVNS